MRLRYGARHAIAVSIAAFLSSNSIPRLAAQDLAITGVRAHLVTASPGDQGPASDEGPVVEDATILVSGGRISALARGLPAPPGARVVDGRGLDAWPGFIDCGTTLGLAEIGSVPGSVDTQEIGDWNAHLRAAAAVNPHSDHLPVARANGITTALVLPGGGVLQGRPAILDLLGRTVPQMEVAPARPLLVLRIPEPPARAYTEEEDKNFLAETEKGWKKLEDHLAAARRLGGILAAGPVPALQGIPGQERLSLLALAAHLREEAPFLVRADAREHILACLRFAEKHRLKFVLAGLREGWKCREKLAAAGHALVVGPPFAVPDRDDPYDANYANAAALRRAGVRFGLMSGSSANVRNLPYQAAMMVAFGLPRAAALRALTLGGAEALGIAATHGALAPGLMADIVLWRGDPLDARADPVHVIAGGVLAPRETRHTRLAAPFLPTR